jgi:atypical dual specificity phosphatase
LFRRHFTFAHGRRGIFDEAEGDAFEAALGQIIRVRRQISTNTGFLRQLEEMEAELYGCCSLEVEELPKREKDRLALFEGHEEQPKVATAVVATGTTSSELS